MAKQDTSAPIYMLNVLWFKPDDGKQTYQQYLHAVQPIVAKYGGKKLDSYVPDLEVIGTFDADLIFTVEWPSWEIFQQFIHDDDFLSIRHLREEALDRSLLIRCRKVG